MVGLTPATPSTARWIDGEDTVRTQWRDPVEARQAHIGRSVGPDRSRARTPPRASSRVVRRDLPNNAADGCHGRGVTQYERDAFGRVTAETDPLGAVTRYTWDTEGNLTARQAPGGAIETFTSSARSSAGRTRTRGTS
ncbi:RHS repeat domain-containing protein [Kitasatospora sp. NPDC085879]|uniref:RHS repeat domain-containing protein n=1 Tax=Kitasatospora sp. NPDC085879 TaxID=3154769 RepID=UPI00341A6E20